MSSEEKNRLDTDFTDPADFEPENLKTPFYSSVPWLVLWSLLVWPIGVLMLWKFADDTQKSKMSRTHLIDRPEDF